MSLALAPESSQASSLVTTANLSIVGESGKSAWPKLNVPAVQGFRA